MLQQTRHPEEEDRRGTSLARVLALAWLGLVLAVPVDAQNYVKWDQPPDPAQPDNLYYGWNEESTYWDFGPTVADDWVCDSDDPVVGIRWWGSFLDWNWGEPPELPSHFHIMFWTDVPADPGDPNSFSHPGQVIHEIICYDYRFEFVGWDYDPRIGEYEACFQFDQDFGSGEWFYQDPSGDPTIYWVSISACYDAFPPPPHPWGWKTRPRDPESPAPDDAVVIWEPPMPVLGSWYVDGWPIEYPDGVSWDMAFELIAQGEGGDVKWEQPPVFNPDSQYPDCFWGWDEPSDYFMMTGPIVADDWACLDDRPVTDVHWWGSYLDWFDQFPPMTPFGFHIGIWTDVPAGEDDWFSHPGMMIWDWWVPYEETMETPVGCDFHPDWTPVPETCFRYTFNIPESEWFWQDPAGALTIFWISIAADFGDIWPERPWGWKTRPRDPNSLAPDDAVRIWSPPQPVPGSMYEQGEPIYWPTPQESWDTAFVLTTTGGGQPYVKWSQPPQPYIPDDAFNGWNEYSVYCTETQIVADDWVCQNPDPITDLHWWGSFLGWSHPYTPLQMPEAFIIGIWTDVPSSGEPADFSHPGEMIWGYWCEAEDYEYRFVGWDFDPRNPFMPPEACFYFECDIPEDLWFYQDPTGDPTIYWVSISAYYGGSPEEYPWGWKTRPRDPDSPAPDDAVRIFDPTEPIPGDSYVRGEPIYWPTPADSWDMAFQLTATHEEEPGLVPKWTQEPGCYDGFDAESNLWVPGEGPGFPKWVQPPNVNWPGIHSDQLIQLADDWRCEGGLVTDLHWFGNYESEQVGVGLAGFNLWIYADAGGMPAGPPGLPLWSTWVPFAAANETDTGLVNSEGCRIYRYDHFLDNPFDQVQGDIYWLVIQAIPNAGDPEPTWRWQEAGRSWPPILNPAMFLTAGAGWIPICWADETCTDFAFIVTSDVPGQEVNKVVADDFISDGRDILALNWFGSYFDDRYLPGAGDPLHVIDGWLIGVHWADINQMPQYPPELLLDGHPTVLAVYFAPASAVQIWGLDCTDCNGHALYRYLVHLGQCCLVCTHPDPRNNYPPPGQPGAFQELGGYRYWLSIQAVTGVEWVPDACEPVLTGHLPPLEPGTTGAFWGWHTGFEPPDWPGVLNVSAMGKIVDFTPYPPECWDYGLWVEQPWECPTEPIPVNQAFALLASDCPEDLNGDGLINLSDLAALLAGYGSCVGSTTYSTAADLNNDGCINLPDLAQLLSVYGQNCPTW